MLAVSGGRQTSLDEVITPTKVPKAALMARQRCRDAALEVTPSNLRKLMTGTEFNSLATSFRGSLTPDAKAEYKKLRSDDERRAWICQWVIDPAAGTASGFNRTTNTVSTQNVDSEAGDRCSPTAVLGGCLVMVGVRIGSAV